MKKYVSGLLAGLLVCVSLPVWAGDISVSGYASFAGTYSNAVNSSGTAVPYYFGLASKELQFDTEDDNIGLQFSAKASDKVDMTLVIRAQGGSTTNNYNIGTEWAYATYHVNDDLQVRIGRYKGPFYMISDYQNVGYAYPWVRPPLEVYSTNPIQALSGLDVLWQKNIGNTRVLFELYGGEGAHKSKVMAEVADSSGGNYTVGQEINFETSKSVGVNMSISGDVGSFRLGYYRTRVNVDSFKLENQLGTFGGAGFTIDKDNVVIYSEYIIRNTEDTALMQSAFPDQRAYYVTMGYRFGKYLPYLTYAKIDEGTYKSKASQVQDSVALGLRAEVGDASAIKFEAMRVTPHANSYGLAYGLFDAAGVKNAYVYTATFDTTF